MSDTMSKGDARKARAKQIIRLIRQGISHAADLLIKVQHAKAGGYAQAMAEAASRHGDQKEHEYWKRIAEEVNKRLAAPPTTPPGKPV